MDTDAKLKERNFLREFIECYRNCPACWNPKSLEYSNRSIKETQSQILLKKYVEFYPTATMRDMMKKINSLRSNYKREVKRLDKIGRSGCLDESTNISNLWYFDIFSFIQDDEEQNTNIVSFNENDDSEPPPKKKLEEPAEAKERISVVPVELFQNDETRKSNRRNQVQEIIIEPSVSSFSQSLPKLQRVPSRPLVRTTNPVSPPPLTAFKTTPSHSSKPKAKPQEIPSVEEMMKVVSRKLSEGDSVYHKEAEVWAMKIQNMDPTQALFTGKLINEIIFQGQLGNLHFNTTLKGTRNELSRSSQIYSDSSESESPTNSQLYVE